jgi:hypothetical protein
MKSTSTIVFIAILLALGCKREEPTSWDIDARVPLLRGSLGWEDLIADSLLSTDENGLLHLQYVTSLINLNPDTLVALSDTTIKRGFVPPFSGTIPIPPGQSVFSQQQNMVLGINTAQIKELIIESGTMQYELMSKVNGPLDLFYGIPGATLGGTPFSLSTTTAPGTVANPYFESGTIDLSGYTFDLTGTTGGSSNRLAFSLQADIASTAAGNISVSANDSLTVRLRFTDMKVAYARGYFGSILSDIDQQIDLEPLSAIAGGNLNLQELSFDLEIENYVGADIQLKIDALKGVRGNNFVSLYHQVIGSAINITRAIDLGNSIQGNTYSYQINQNNSNVVNLFNLLPEALDIAGTIELNPLGDVSGGNDFIYPAQPIKASINLDIPLCVGVNGVVFLDTLDTQPIDIPSTSGTLFLRAENGFPMSVALTFSFLTNNGEEIVLASNQSIYSAETDVFGYSQTPTAVNLGINLTTDQIESIKTGGQMIIKATANSTGIVKFNGSERLDIRILAAARTEISYE